jgi:hypothetical protein
MVLVVDQEDQASGQVILPVALERLDPAGGSQVLAGLALATAVVDPSPAYHVGI